MSFLNRFKKEEEKKVEKKPKVSVEKKAAKKAPDKASTEKKEVSTKKKSEIAYKILKGPHVTEKATDLTGNDQYIFEVFPRANKIQVKKAVEELYGVDVLSVNMINIHSKTRRYGRTVGKKPGYKKAIVRIKKGQVIELMPR